MSRTPFIGVDFGTTNSAVALAAPGEEARLARLSADGDPTFRSILFFDADERGPDRKPLCYVGDRAINVALDPLFEGRLVQSIKSYLANAGFRGTSIFGTRYALSDLVSLILRQLARSLEAEGVAPDAGPIVAGRPARFVGHEVSDGEDLALTRLRDAYRFSGFGEVEFEFEPVAAAYRYATRLDEDELVLIADFGGGTSDFCLLTVGPSLRNKAAEENAIIAVDGVGLAGDAFDARIVEHVISERLGKGSLYEAPSGKSLPMPAWIYDQLKAWHRLSFLNAPKTHQILDEVIDGAEDPSPIMALKTLITDNLGFQLYTAVEKTKHDLSFHEETSLDFTVDPITIKAPVRRADFNTWIAPELQKISDCVDGLLKSTNHTYEQIDRVFMTGGTAFVPAVRDIFARRFGQEKLRGGEELTSVASGLALVARDRFGG